MDFSKRVPEYAAQHPQEVTLSWIDNSDRVYDADKAMQLCSMPKVAACIVGAKCENEILEAMLNRLINGE